MFDVKRVKTVG